MSEILCRKLQDFAGRNPAGYHTHCGLSFNWIEQRKILTCGTVLNVSRLFEATETKSQIWILTLQNEPDWLQDTSQSLEENPLDWSRFWFIQIHEKQGKSLWRNGLCDKLRMCLLSLSFANLARHEICRSKPSELFTTHSVQLYHFQVQNFISTHEPKEKKTLDFANPLTQDPWHHLIRWIPDMCPKSLTRWLTASSLVETKKIVLTHCVCGSVS